MSDLVPYTNNASGSKPIASSNFNPAAQQRYIDLMEVTHQSLQLNATLLQGTEDWELGKSRDDLELEAIGSDLDDLDIEL